MMNVPVCSFALNFCGMLRPQVYEDESVVLITDTNNEVFVA